MLVSPVNFRRSNEASSGYDVVITAADGKEHRFPQRIDTATAEIPFDKLPSGKKSESDETGYTVHIVECIKMDGGKTEYALTEKNTPKMIPCFLRTSLAAMIYGRMSRVLKAKP